MNSLKPGTLFDGIVCDHALPMYGDGEYRIARGVEEPDIDVEADEAPEVPEVPEVVPEGLIMDMVTFVTHLNRLRRM